MKNYLYYVRLSAVIILCTQVSSVVNCQTLLNENFSYQAGSSLTANGWNAHDDPGTNPVLISSTGLVFRGYLLSDIDFAANLSNTGEDVNKSFAPLTSGTIFCAFMVKVETVSNGYFIHLSNSGISSYRGRVYIKGSGNSFNLGLSKGAENPVYYTGATYATGIVYLVVLKYTIAEGNSNDEVCLYIIDSSIPGTEPSVPSVGPLTDAGQTDLSNVSSVALRQYSSSQKIIIDGIRVATKWEEAVGLPTTNKELSLIDAPEIFPVPATNELVIKNILNFNSLEIFDISGRKVTSMKTNRSETIKIPVGSFPKGAYIVRFNNNRFYKIMRFIKS